MTTFSGFQHIFNVYVLEIQIHASVKWADGLRGIETLRISNLPVSLYRFLFLLKLSCAVLSRSD